AIQVNDAIALLVANQAGMMGGNLWMIEHNLVICQATHGDEGIVQGYRANGWQRFLRCTTAIIEGERDQGAVLISDAEDISTFERPAKRLIASDDLSLIHQAIGRARSGRMWMQQNKLVLIAYDLHMKAGDGR